MKTLITAFIALSIFGSQPSAFAQNCEETLYPTALAQARRVDPTGHFRIATAFRFPSGPVRVVVGDGAYTITVDMTVDRYCRVLAISTSSDLDNANGG
jgi:hypothetical protein